MRFASFEARAAHDEQTVIEAVNRTLRLGLRHDHSKDEIFCTDGKGTPYVIVGSRGGTATEPFYTVRGVLRPKRNGRPWSYLFNGQPGKNCVPAKGAGQGEEWLRVKLTPTVPVQGVPGVQAVTPDEVERVEDDPTNVQQGGMGKTYHGSRLILKDGSVCPSNAPAHHYTEQYGLTG